MSILRHRRLEPQQSAGNGVRSPGGRPPVASDPWNRGKKPPILGSAQGDVPELNAAGHTESALALPGRSRLPTMRWTPTGEFGAARVTISIPCIPAIPCIPNRS
jgi:hypothetical protein